MPPFWHPSRIDFHTFPRLICWWAFDCIFNCVSWDSSPTWLPNRSRRRSIFTLFFYICPQGFLFMILVSFWLPFWHLFDSLLSPFGSLLLLFGFLLAPFSSLSVDVPPFEHPSAPFCFGGPSTCDCSSKVLFFANPSPRVTRRLLFAH